MLSYLSSLVSSKRKAAGLDLRAVKVRGHLTAGQCCGDWKGRSKGTVRRKQTTKTHILERETAEDLEHNKASFPRKRSGYCPASSCADLCDIGGTHKAASHLPFNFATIKVLLS